MRLWLDEEEVHGLEQFELNVNPYLEPSFGPYVTAHRNVSWIISLKEEDAGAIMESFGNPTRTLSVQQDYKWSRWQRLRSFVMRLLEPWGGHRLPKSVGINIGGLRPVSMRRRDGIIEVEFSNRPVEP